MSGRWFGGRRSRADGGPRRGAARGDAVGRDRPGDLDRVLADTVARHFPHAAVDGAVVRLGVGNVEIACRVDEPSYDAERWSTALYLYLSGGDLGARPVFASISGYHGESPGQAVVEGGCMWSCSFGPVLVSALTGVLGSEVRQSDVVVGGRTWRLTIGSFDRAFTAQGTDGRPLARQVRERLGGVPDLTPLVLDAVPDHLISDRDAVLLSVFVMEGWGRRTVEVKVNGVDTPVAWPGEDLSPSPARGLALLRELAVLVPLERPVRSLALPDPWDRAGVERVLAHLGASNAPGQVAGWRGWRTHQGRLGAVMPAASIARFESVVGPLPDDFRHFLTEVAGPGAGPGYGLLSPRRVGDVVPLAQAGCNAVWVLRVGEDDYGSVWVDSTPLDGRRHRVADSFTAWYRDWLDNALLGRGAWIHWDPDACPTAGLRAFAEREGIERSLTPAGLPDLSGVVTKMAINGWNDYLPRPSGGASMVDPCQGCAETLARHNVPEDVIEPGALSRRP